MSNSCQNMAKRRFGYLVIRVIRVLRVIRGSKFKNIFLLLLPFHKQQGWCPAGND
jgi:hypothetical protein